MNEAKTIVKSYWDQQSSTFDMSPGHVASSKREEDAWKALLQEKIGSREKMVLDIGVGTGFLSIMLAEMGYNVVGIDLSEAMIKIARKKIDDRDLKIRLELVDLPLHGGIDPSAVTNLLKKAGYIDVSSDHLTEIGRIKSENMPWYHRISSQKSERYCYHCRKSKR
jgi:SAM-dependent methyltransferase